MFCEAVCSRKVEILPAHFTHEAWFSFNGYENIQNNRSWLADNYKLIHPVPLCDTKIGVWCAINATRIIGTNLFSGTFKAESYTTLDKGHPATGQGGPTGSGWVKAPDFLDVQHYEGVGRQPYAPAAFSSGEILGTYFRRLSRP